MNKEILKITNKDIELLKEMKKNCLKSNVYEDDKRLLKSNAITKFLMLYEENQELKKQLETYEIEGYEQNEELNKMSFDIRKYKVQQKEFIKYLEDEIKRLKENDIYQPLQKMALATHEHILQKYKSIIGGASNE